MVNKTELKPATFVGSSLRDLRELPRSARREAGFQLDKIQQGEDPADWKPMETVGSGACGIRVRDESGAFRLIICREISGSGLRAPRVSEKDAENGKDGLSSRQGSI